MEIPISLGLAWILFIVYSCFKKEAGNPDLVLVLTHITFLVLFVVSIVVLYKAFALKNKITLEEKTKANELTQQTELEQKRYDLYKEERLEKDRYNRLIAIIDKLDSKKDPKDDIIKKLEHHLIELKKQKDNEILVKVAGDFGIELNNNTKKEKQENPKTGK